MTYNSLDLARIVCAAADTGGGGAPTSQRPEPELKPLAFYAARSFWILVVAVISTALKVYGIDLADSMGFTNDAGIVDVIMDVIPLVAPLLVWRERLNPRRQLTVTGPLQ